MYQPRKSILQMFDPLMTSPPQREESNASPDNSDKENDVPHDPLSLTQYFNRTYRVKGLQKPVTPTGKLIDFGDISIDRDEELTPPRPSEVATEAQLDDGDALIPAQSLTVAHEDCDDENATSFPSNGPFVTPQNRRILGDIDVDALQPPKPPVKQGPLKISFHIAASDVSRSSPAEASTSNVAPSDPKPDSVSPGPVITLYPPTFDSIPPTSSAPQISDKVDDYLSPQFPRTVATFTPRRSPLSSEQAPNRISMDLHSSFQLQLQDADYSFDLVNDNVSFLETGQELSFPEPDDDSDVDEIVEDVGVEGMFRSLTLQDKAMGAAKRIFSPTSEKFPITSIPERHSETSPKSEAPQAVSPMSVSPSQDLGETKPATTTSVSRKPAGSIRRQSLASRSSIPGFQPATTASNPPMRVLVPPFKRPTTITTTQRTTVVRPPLRQSSTAGTLLKPVVATKPVGKLTDGPRRVLVQANDKPIPRTVSTSAIPVHKTQGPQRVLVRTASGTANPVKKPLGPSSSINPPAPASRLPGPSRIAVPGILKPMARTSGGSKPNGRWV